MGVDGRIVGLCAVMMLLGVMGCGGEAATETLTTEQVYFDEELNRPVLAPRGLETPAVNPVTGHKTLLPAMYCRECEAWRPVPPLEEMQRDPKARNCLECKRPLWADGPLPEIIDTPKK